MLNKGKNKNDICLFYYAFYLYQQNLSKVIILKRFTQIAMSSAFRRVPCN